MNTRLFSRPVPAKMLRCLLWTGLALVAAPVAPALAQGAAAADPSFLASLQQQLVNALAWIDGLGAIAPLAFILLYIVITVAFVYRKSVV